ncbi:L-aspartate oxidase [Corynebacterium halotolerans]|uniref:L-aspartate oxidase n=1 Tax=Corynebacterium halotolerans YIM 70093 = DSM 44683 TaxID=1121362 RepID=M1P4M5_9CORY|nr:L-aspartate oxidase [Corynebacterium halotolerans]AGF71596.1 L-aspartate oxidase [Corynebacterium halotolerans YIM 70093 = DSM 44683]
MTPTAPAGALATPAPTWRRETGAVIIGSGAAGLATAVHLAEAGVPAMLLTRATDPADSSTDWAQGGLAAVWDSADSPEAHVADTLTAGAGLCDPAAVRTLVDAAPHAVRRLIALGARFDRGGDGDDYDLHLEGGHSTRRILHARGDGSGREVERTLVNALRRRLDRPGCSVRLRTGLRAVDVLTDAHGAAAGVRVRDATGRIGDLLADSVVLATGGAGQAWTLTSNPGVATGDGLAMAWRVGAVLRDVEFTQFHPTILHRRTGQERSGGRDVLISEAVRGEGAVLIDHAGRRVMAGVHPLADLAPRDVISAAMHARMLATGEEYLLLDARHFSARAWATKFPGILAMLRERGIDPVTEPIPVRPGAHYLCGGVAADMDGRTSVPGLYAIGEVAATGVQGANRLASNSVTEALVMGDRCGQLLASAPPGRAGEPVERPAVALTDAAARTRIHGIMDTYVGVLRTAEGLDAAIDGLDALPTLPVTRPDVDDATLDTTALHAVGRLIARAARERDESRGAHRRADHPQTSGDWESHLRLAPGAAGEIVITHEPVGAVVAAV